MALGDLNWPALLASARASIPCWPDLRPIHGPGRIIGKGRRFSMAARNREFPFRRGEFCIRTTSWTVDNEKSQGTPEPSIGGLQDAT